MLSGIAAVLVALGSGLGAFLRYRRAAKAIKFRSKLDSINASSAQNSLKSAQEAAERLATQYEARLTQSQETIDRLNRAHDEQRHLYEDRLANQQSLINNLLDQILKQRK